MVKTFFMADNFKFSTIHDRWLKGKRPEKQSTKKYEGEYLLQFVILETPSF
jgi:hypothetical protein